MLDKCGCQGWNAFIYQLELSRIFPFLTLMYKVPGCMQKWCYMRQLWLISVFSAYFFPTPPLVSVFLLKCLCSGTWRPSCCSWLIHFSLYPVACCHKVIWSILYFSYVAQAGYLLVQQFFIDNICNAKWKIHVCAVAWARGQNSFDVSHMIMTTQSLNLSCGFCFLLLMITKFVHILSAHDGSQFPNKVQEFCNVFYACGVF